MTNIHLGRLKRLKIEKKIKFVACWPKFMTNVQKTGYVTDKVCRRVEYPVPDTEKSFSMLSKLASPFRFYFSLPPSASLQVVELAESAVKGCLRYQVMPASHFQQFQW